MTHIVLPRVSGLGVGFGVGVGVTCDVVDASFYLVFRVSVLVLVLDLVRIAPLEMSPTCWEGG